MVTTVALLDDGTGGDATVGEGVYTGLFTNTSTDVNQWPSGLYLVCAAGATFTHIQKVIPAR